MRYLQIGLNIGILMAFYCCYARNGQGFDWWLNVGSGCILMWHQGGKHPKNIQGGWSGIELHELNLIMFDGGVNYACFLMVDGE